VNNDAKGPSGSRWEPTHESTQDQTETVALPTAPPETAGSVPEGTTTRRGPGGRTAVVGLGVAGVALAAGLAGFLLGHETSDAADHDWEAGEQSQIPGSDGDDDDGAAPSSPDAESLPGLPQVTPEQGDELSQLLKSGGDVLQQYLEEQGAEQLRQLLEGQSS
jgi:hypothetical protein